jgi:hypothetical protein
MTKKRDYQPNLHSAASPDMLLLLQIIGSTALLGLSPSVIEPCQRSLRLPPKYIRTPSRSGSVTALDDGDTPLSDGDIKQKLSSLRKRGGPRGRSYSPGRSQGLLNEDMPEAVTDVSDPNPPKIGAPSSSFSVNRRTSAMDRLKAQTASQAIPSPALDASVSAEVVHFLNAELGDAMLQWVMQWTEIGATAASKNSWMRHSWVPVEVHVEAVSQESLRFSVAIEEHRKTEHTMVTAELPLPHAVETVNDLRDSLLRLCDPPEDGSNRAKWSATSTAGAALLRLPKSTDDWSLPGDLWLNTTPYPRKVRQLFYSDVARAMQAAVADASCPRRMRVHVTPPCAAPFDPAAS